MYIYYPSNATVYVRQVNNGALIEQYISYAPDQVIIISGSGAPSASTVFLTASLAYTSSLSRTASYALQGGDPLMMQMFT